MTETSPSETSLVRTGRKTRRRPGQDRRQALVEAAYRRIAEVRAVVASREEGWRISLAELFASGAPAGTWAPAVDPAVAGELVIAAVKGASLDPEHAVGALRQLELLLIKD